MYHFPPENLGAAALGAALAAALGAGPTFAIDLGDIGLAVGTLAIGMGFIFLGAATTLSYATGCPHAGQNPATGSDLILATMLAGLT